MRRGREAAHIARPWARSSRVSSGRSVGRVPARGQWPPAVGRATKAAVSGRSPPKVEEISAVVRAAGDDAHGVRRRGLIVILWRAEALALAEADLDPYRGACSCATARAAGAARSGWTRGAGSSCSLARNARADTVGLLLVNPDRRDARLPLVHRGRRRAGTPRRRCAPALRAASAAPG